jgi:hypothetical protein
MRAIRLCILAMGIIDNARLKLFQASRKTVPFFPHVPRLIARRFVIAISIRLRLAVGLSVGQMPFAKVSRAIAGLLQLSCLAYHFGTIEDDCSTMDSGWKPWLRRGYARPYSGPKFWQARKSADSKLSVPNAFQALGRKTRDSATLCM